MNERPRVSKNCPGCDGENVFQVTYWRWSVVSQDWESADDDLIRCADCDWKGYDVKTKPIEGEEE